MYTQEQEEKIILDYIALNEGMEKTILDIGAFDGTTFSNSRRLIELGWSAALVEPLPEPFVKLQELYRENKNVHLLNTAVTSRGGIMPFFYESVGFHDDHKMLGTTIEHFFGHSEKWKSAQIQWGAFYLSTITAKELFTFLKRDKHFLPSIVSIDIEGGNWNLLMSVLCEHSPEMIILEHDDILSAPVGYNSIWRGSINEIFVKEKI